MVIGTIALQPPCLLEPMRPDFKTKTGRRPDFDPIVPISLLTLAPST